MKKMPLLITAFICLTGLHIFSQPYDTVAKQKKQWFCSVKITMTDNTKDTYALSRFSGDTIFVWPLIQKENKKELQLDEEKGIAAGGIRKIFIRIDKQIVLPAEAGDRFSTGTMDTAASTLTKLHHDNMFTNYLLDQALLFPFDPVSDLASLGMGLILGPYGKTYYIKSRSEKFNKMARQLTRTNSTPREDTH